MLIRTSIRTYTPTWEEGNHIFLKRLLRKAASKSSIRRPFSLKLFYES